MSIYATLWHVQFPKHGDAYEGCQWVDVFAQGVPAHIGRPTPGYGYESGDPYAAFLPPALRIGGNAAEDDWRAVVFIMSTTKKGTARSAQEYESPLLVLTGTEYATTPFQVLHDRLCTTLRGSRPPVALEMFWPDSTTTLVFDDGTTTPGPPSETSVDIPSARMRSPSTEQAELALLRTLALRVDEMKNVFEESSSHWAFEDPVYRFYHQSSKVYAVQRQTQAIARLLAGLLPARTLNQWFLQIVAEGTGKRFTLEDNADWLRITRPLLEAFFHARFFLEMAIRYAELVEPPRPLPSGYAALLYLYGLR